MGDRCRLSITMRKKDKEKFTEVFLKEKPDSWSNFNLFDEEIEEGQTLECIVYEANYGWYTELEAVAAAGLIFEGVQGAGGEYGASDFVSNGSEMFYCPTYESFGRCLPVEPTDEDMAGYDKFLEAEAEVKEYLKGEQNAGDNIKQT